jgi:hypothetical protein
VAACCRSTSTRVRTASAAFSGTPVRSITCSRPVDVGVMDCRIAEQLAHQPPQESRVVAKTEAAVWCSHGFGMGRLSTILYGTVCLDHGPQPSVGLGTEAVGNPKHEFLAFTGGF